MHRSRPALALVLLAAVVGLVLGVTPAEATPEGLDQRADHSASNWARAEVATIRPGSEMVTKGAQCTGNFVFTDGTDVFLGYAAHCAGRGAVTDTNGCRVASLPTDGSTKVRIEGASRPGTLVYSSWETMRRVRERNSNACRYNDFALVRIHRADRGKVNPSVPHWGGPTGLNTTGIGQGRSVYGYGNSGLRLGIRALSPKTGRNLGTTARGWVHVVYTVSPGIPGDSGSALLDPRGRAAGVLSTMEIAPLAGSNDYSDLASALRYMRRHGGPDARLVRGTEPFEPGRLPVGIGR